MFLSDWFSGVVAWLGLREKKKVQLLFSGLDNSGLSTLLRLLQDERLLVDVQREPAQYPASEELRMPLKVDAVVYVVNAYERERFAEAKKKLDGLLADESLADVPFLILGNKIHFVAAEKDELCYHLGLPWINTVDKVNPLGRPLEVFMCCSWHTFTYRKAFLWLSNHIN